MNVKRYPNLLTFKKFMHEIKFNNMPTYTFKDLWTINVFSHWPTILIMGNYSTNTWAYIKCIYRAIPWRILVIAKDWKAKIVHNRWLFKCTVVQSPNEILCSYFKNTDSVCMLILQNLVISEEGRLGIRSIACYILCRKGRKK